ncbi:MAG: hypothetical protein LRZ97_00020 [Candidatus Pacebacteria bacterium]|nr:hypothetical protein [Candidatus Paceibacterota bacterium]
MATSSVSTTDSNGFSNNGLYDCEGGNFGSVGLSHARGTFVPVSEEAVALNTNILLYKECVLDRVVVAYRESAIAAMTQSLLSWVGGDQDGQSAFVTNQKNLRDELRDEVTQEFTSGKMTDGICAPLKEDVRKTIFLENAQRAYKPEQIYNCSITSEEEQDYKDFLDGTAKVFNRDIYFKTLSPENNPLLVYFNASQLLQEEIDTAITDEIREIGWGNGYKSKKDCKQIPSGNSTYEEYCEIVTPGSTIGEIISYVSLTGMRQTENADEINELMGSLMSNIHTQVLTSTGGLSGLAKSINGGLSFLDLISRDAALRTRTEYTNVGVGLLSTAIVTESEYGAARKLSQDKIEDIVIQLQTKEAACWSGLIAQAKLDLIAEARELACNSLGYGLDVCPISGAATVDPLEYAPHYDDILIDIDEQLQDTIILARAADKRVQVTLARHNKNYLTTLIEEIAPLLNVVRQSVADSTTALTLLTGLQVRLSAASSPSETRSILEEVDQLVADGTLHKTADVHLAQEQHTRIVGSMGDLYTDIVATWDETWCDPLNWRDQIKE